MPLDRHSPHILGSNHSPEILDLVRELLEEEGYRVTTQSRDAATLDGIVALGPDLIVIDYMWPHSDNEWTLLNLLRIDRRTRHLPVVLCTGAVQQVRDMADHLASLGIRVVLKPFDIDQLAAEVADALTGREPEAQRG